MILITHKLHLLITLISWAISMGFGFLEGSGRALRSQHHSVTLENDEFVAPGVKELKDLVNCCISNGNCDGFDLDFSLNLLRGILGSG